MNDPLPVALSPEGLAPAAEGLSAPPSEALETPSPEDMTQGEGQPETPAPTVEQRLAALEADRTRLEKENRALQGKIDRETAVERRARVEAEGENRMLREDIRALRDESRKTVGDTIAQIEDPEERYKRLLEVHERDRSATLATEEGLRWYDEFIALRAEYAISEDELAQYFDARLLQPSTWARQKDAAVQAVRIGWEKTKTARAVTTQLAKARTAQQGELQQDQQHARRSEVAAQGALTPDRPRVAASSVRTRATLEDDYMAGRISHEEFRKHAQSWGLA